MKDGGAFEWFAFIKELAVSCVPFTYICAHLFDYVDHFRVKITYPVHFIIIIALVHFLENSF